MSHGLSGSGHADAAEMGPTGLRDKTDTTAAMNSKRFFKVALPMS
jgi:hypothetical protein